MEYPKPKTLVDLSKHGKRYKKGNAGNTVFCEKYKGLSFEQRLRKAALEASDNGRCWWIEAFLRVPIYTYESKDHISIDTSNLDN